jgi:hypothetical protein
MWPARRSAGLAGGDPGSELTATDSETERQVGITALNELTERSDVTAADKRLINAVLDVALAPVTTTWEDVRGNGASVEVVALEPPEQEEQ